MSSCDDFLTVLPTGQITEEHFWQDRNDLENVRAGAYKKFIDQTSSIFYWGELRSDNVKLKDQSNTTLLYMQQAILRPSNNNYSWANFYTGINYCNKVIEYGDNMTNEPLVDPSFGKSDYRPIEAEMKALRALYYFYLVRAFRDVPYVTNSVSTDKEAKEAYYYPSSGEAILGEMISQLEEVKDYGTINYGSNSENHGRFTKRSIYALLADLYLWRGCMLKNYSKKFDVSGNLRAVNLNDVVNLNADGDTIGYTTVDSVAVNDEYCNSKATECFQKAAERAQFVIDELNKDRKENMEISRSFYNTYEQEDIYPLTHCNFKVGQNVQNKVYSTIWGNNNSSESIFELQFDGTQNSCGTYASYMSSYASNSVSIGSIIANDILTTGIGQDRPTQGFGKKDLRLLETIGYTDEFISASTLPIVKNVIREFNVADLENMAEGYAGDPDYRVSTNMNANWPIYRLSDMMMIKAEAYARLGTNLNEGYMLYNHLYNR
ncbi:MAG: RagB/SusD family nutrient uptake outer membrane protein, partial [Bacteroidaceae bacterium]|nr:RagB/SusD family nutrient uptake outer membrane protein [Bacteroidaceae bacterium]